MASVELEFLSEPAARAFLDGNLGTSARGGRISVIGEDVFVGATKAGTVQVKGATLTFKPTALGFPPDFKAAMLKAAKSLSPGALEKFGVRVMGAGGILRSVVNVAGNFSLFADVARAAVGSENLRDEVDGLAREALDGSISSPEGVFFFCLTKGVPHLSFSVWDRIQKVRLEA